MVVSFQKNIQISFERGKKQAELVYAANVRYIE